MSTGAHTIRDVLDSAAEGSLARKIKTVRELKSLFDALPVHCRVRVLRNCTVENIEPLIRFHSARAGVAAEVSFSDFDTVEQEAYDPASETNTGGHDLVLVTLWSDSLFTGRGDGSPDAEAIFARIRRLLISLRDQTTATIAATTLLPPSFALGGGLVQGGPAQPMAQIVRAINAQLSALVQREHRLCLIDLAELVAELGADKAIDARLWYLYKAPFRYELLDRLARQVTGIIGAIKGVRKKVLALDCDNTLWGGIIGEDGLEGIALEPHSYPGSAFRDFQRQILELKSRGIVLALCTKNNEADVLDVLDRHPHCLVKRADFAAWRINWEDKASNLIALAESLNLSLDSFVFVDDNPAECELIGRLLPTVTVLQVPDQPHKIPAMLREFVGFDSLGLSEEDLARTRMYEQERHRSELRVTATDLEAYLASLDLRVRIGPARRSDILRVAQLTQKTNQFNLTTRRYSEADIERLCAAGDHLVVAMRVSDRFGDYGLTGVSVLRFEASAAIIEAFLLSCRVLGRNVEFALLDYVSKAAATRPGVTRLRASYIRTPKNHQVATFYDRAGFTPASDAAALHQHYDLPVPAAGLPTVPEYIRFES